MKIYTASKLSHAPLWNRLKIEWPEVEFTARWPFLHVGKIPDEPAFATVFWQHDLADVKAADAVLCYGESNDVLRGALVEAGMALALGKSVIVVDVDTVSALPNSMRVEWAGNDSFGTWQYHPLVSRVRSLADARLLISMLANK